MAFERLIQLTLRARNFLSKDVEPASDSMRELAEEGRRLKTALEEAGRARGLARTLRDNQQATEGLERAQRDAVATLEDLTREIGDQEQATAGQRIALREARRTLDEAERAYKRNQQAIKNTTSELQKLGVDTDNAAAEEKRLTGELEDGKKALADNREAIKQKRVEEKKAADTAKEHADRVGAARGVMADAGKKVLAFAAAYVSLNAAFNLVRGGLNLMRDGLRAVIADGSSNEQALAQLESALASTGNAAGLTAQQLLDMADEFKRSSMLSTEEILSAQTRLLSYTDIVASEFPAAMQIVIDQQQRLGISVEQSAEIVGRALQSPSEAIATLGRQGFKFEAGQKALLKQLEATGRKAEAQAVIMDMLTEAYGGSAAAARMGTFQGLLKTIGDQFGDFAGRVSSSGAFDFVKGKLAELADNIDAMANDGRLDRLAQGLSDAFVQGAQWVEGFIKQLGGVDFKRLTDDSAAWLSSFGTHLDDAATRVKLFIAPFRTLFNGLTAGLSGFAALVTNKLSEVLGVIGKVAAALPNALGGEKLRAAVADARGVLDGLTEGFKAQVEQDGKDIEAAWTTTTETVKTKAKEQTQAVKQEADDQFQHIVQRVTDMNNALAQIDAAEGAAQLKQLGDEMYAAYQRGDLSQREYASGTVMLQARLRELGGTATTTSREFNDLKSIMAGIGQAANEVDFNQLRTAMRKAYSDGKISADEFAQAQDALNKRVADLKPVITQTAAAGKAATEQLTRSQEMYNEALQDGILTSEELRRVSGQRMDDERRASGEAMARQRQGIDTTQRDMSDMEGFFGGVMSRAREPLAAMSAAALEAFDRLNDISTANVAVDTSSLKATTESLERASRALADMQAAANTVGMSPLGRWMTQTQLQSQKLQIEYLGQKRQLQSLMDGYADGSMTLEQFVRRAGSARSALGLLDDADLSGLESAIASANQRMEQMANSTRSTLESLQDELDALQGRQEDIDARRMASRRRDLQAQQAEAMQSGDATALANAQAALRVLSEIERESARQQQLAERQKRADEAAKTAPAVTQPQQPAKVIRLETARGQAVDVGVSSPADETKLLSILESAGLRSL